MRHRDDARREVQANQFRVRTFLRRGRIIAIGNQYPGVMAGAAEDFVDLGMDELVFEQERILDAGCWMLDARFRIADL